MSPVTSYFVGKVSLTLCNLLLVVGTWWTITSQKCLIIIHQGLSSSPAPSLRPAARLKLRFQCSSKRFRIIFWTSLLYCGRFQKAECRDHKESPPTPILKSDPNKLPGWSQYLRNFETQEWTQTWSVNPFFLQKLSRWLVKISIMYLFVYNFGVRQVSTYREWASCLALAHHIYLRKSLRRLHC